MLPTKYRAIEEMNGKDGDNHGCNLIHDLGEQDSEFDG